MDNYWSKKEEQITEELLAFCKEHVTVVIPCLDEEHSIKTVIDNSKNYCKEILLVDGHSKDNTVAIAKELGARVCFDNKKGKGDAIRVSIGEVKTDVILFIDADLSHNPHDIPKLIKPIFADGADHVIGSRPRGGSDELHGDFNKFMRMVGSDIITLGINYRFNVRITDSQNGFRAIKTSVAKALKLEEDITTIEQEMTIKTVKHKYSLVEVPAHEYARKYGDSHIKLMNVSFRYVYSWLKYLLF